MKTTKHETPFLVTFGAVVTLAMSAAACGGMIASGCKGGLTTQDIATVGTVATIACDVGEVLVPLANDPNATTTAGKACAVVDDIAAGIASGTIRARLPPRPFADAGRDAANSAK